MKLQHLAEGTFDAVKSFVEQHCKKHAGCSKASLAKAVQEKFGKPYDGVVNDMHYQLIGKAAAEANRK